MELSDLTDYASKKYYIQEQRKWTDFPGFSVLCHPETGKWVALLMRQWDMELGEEIQCCDLKCGSSCLDEFQKPYLSPPIRMVGKKWAGVRFNKDTEQEVVFLLFDRAMAAEKPKGVTVILDSGVFAGESVSQNKSGQNDPHQNNPHQNDGYQDGYQEDYQDVYQKGISQHVIYQDTPLVFSGQSQRPEKDRIPDRLRQLRNMFRYGRETMAQKAENFYRQAVLMEDYEDDFSWMGGFSCYYPAYQDMTIRQLRGYFSWRAGIRRGEYQPIAVSAAYLYLYELLGGIGASSAEDALEKMSAFEKGFLDGGYGEERLRKNLRRWMMEYAIVQELPPKKVRIYADPLWLQQEEALEVLHVPDQYPDEKVFSSLQYFGGKILSKSPVIITNPERGMHLFAEIWRCAVRGSRSQEKDVLTFLFGEMSFRTWYPLSNALYFWDGALQSRDYRLFECRIYHYRDGVWQTEGYEKSSFDKTRFRAFLREADLKLRRYLKTGHYLREKEEDLWAVFYIDKVIDADQREAALAARPKITIDLAGLDQIRRDALVTRDSLLVEDEADEVKLHGAGGSGDGQILREAEAGDSAIEQIFKEVEAGADVSADGRVVGDVDVSVDGLAAGDVEASVDRLAAGDADVSTDGLAAGEADDSADELATGDAEARTDGWAAARETCVERICRPIFNERIEERFYLKILRALLRNEPVDGLLRENHRMPSITADEINEAFYDEIGDIVVLCEEDQLSVVEDYREDLEVILG